MQRIRESISARQETVDIGILTASMNRGKKITQRARIKSGPPMRKRSDTSS